MMDAHLAQVNVATLRAPMDDAATAEFAAGLDPVNSLAEASPGFVWRLQDESGNATAIPAFDDPLRIVNLTVWESVRALSEFAYRGMHRDFFRRRAEWFTPESRTALWWIPAGTVPTVVESIHRLAFIERHGSSPYAFEIGFRGARLVLAPRPLDHPDAAALIEALNADLVAAGPPDARNFVRLDEHEVAPGNGALLVAYADDVAVGCGAFRLLADRTTAEVKRMYVTPAARGMKVGAALLDALETAGTAAGATRLLLETGPAQTAALALYERSGFEPIPCWGEYADSPTSICLAKPCP